MSPTKKERTEDLETGIVIIGSGGGLVAAVRAAEKGVKDIIVIERDRALGGSGRYAGGATSNAQRLASTAAETDDYFKRVMKWAHCDRVDPRVVRAIVDVTGDTARWIEEKEAEYKKTLSEAQRERLKTMMGGAVTMRALSKKAKDLGVKTLLRTNAKRIFRNAKDGITGVIAAEEDGQEFEIRAKSVIIATGAFHGDVELLKKYCPDFSDKMWVGKWTRSPNRSGDGLRMAAEIGAAIADNIPIFHVGPIPESSPFGDLAYVARAPYMVFINKKGKRFIDEAGYTEWEAGNAIRMQPDMISYTIFDDTIRQKLEETGPLTPQGRVKQTSPWAKDNPPVRKVQTLVDKGAVKKFNSWDEVANWIGAAPDVVKATIDEYNTACDQGRDSIFAKNREHLLPLRKVPYYAIRCCIDSGETMGGIKVTEHMEVLDTEENIIPGLYVGGVLADGWAGQTYGAIGAFSCAVNSGRIAGDSAAKYVLEQK